MEIRLAKKEDLPALEIMYNEIVKAMNNNGIFIWNEYYPYEEFEGDIDKKRLYLMVDSENIIGAFAIFDEIDGSNNFQWENKSAKATYIGRLGVNVNYLRQGLGIKLLNYAENLANKMGSDYLRLTVVDSNMPAINLYKKYGFKNVLGIYKEYSESLNKTIQEIGFELKLK